jgi:acetylornithine deacetylase/succinyl-diaminopimelate desuccinylase-like protein
MGRAIAKIGDLQTPKKPKTTFTVGTVQGGTSVNAIAGDAEMEVDMRSDDNAPLLEIEAKILKAVKDAVAEENARWASDKIGVEIKLVGDRPAGIQPLETPTVQAAFLATGALGMKPRAEGASSTDSNLPNQPGDTGRDARPRRQGRRQSLARRMVGPDRRLPRPPAAFPDAVDAGRHRGRRQTVIA